MSEYVHNTVLLQMVNERITTMMMLAINNTPGNEQVDKVEKEMLKLYRLTCICPSTILMDETPWIQVQGSEEGILC